MKFEILSIFFLHVPIWTVLQALGSDISNIFKVYSVHSNTDQYDFILSYFKS